MLEVSSGLEETELSHEEGDVSEVVDVGPVVFFFVCVGVF